jgi:hypothetical protein
VVVHLDLQTLFANNLPAEREFDALLLADSAGQIIAQHSAEGLEVANISQLPIDRGPAAAAEGTGHTADAGLAPREDACPDTRVVGGRSYHLYVQPLSLSLQRVDSSGALNGVEEWTLCGLAATRG